MNFYKAEMLLAMVKLFSETGFLARSKLRRRSVFGKMEHQSNFNCFQFLLWDEYQREDKLQD